VWGNGAEIWSESTIHQTIGPTAMMFQVLYAAGGQGDTKPEMAAK
jgi:hypothetical protein